MRKSNQARGWAKMWGKEHEEHLAEAHHEITPEEIEEHKVSKFLTKIGKHFAKKASFLLPSPTYAPLQPIAEVDIGDWKVRGLLVPRAFAAGEPPGPGEHQKGRLHVEVR